MTTTAPHHTVGTRTPLGSYYDLGGRRTLFGQRIDGVVHLFDIPTDDGNATDRSYLIESGLEQDGRAAMQSLVAEYIAESERRGEPAILVPRS